MLGLQYGLLGVGLTLIYGLAGVLNLAHGQVAVLGAIAVSLLMDDGCCRAGDRVRARLVARRRSWWSSTSP